MNSILTPITRTSTTPNSEKWTATFIVYYFDNKSRPMAIGKVYYDGEFRKNFSVTLHSGYARIFLSSEKKTLMFKV